MADDSNDLGVDDAVGPPSPYWAGPDQPGTDGPPSELAPSNDVADGPPSPYSAGPDQPGTDGPPSDLAPGNQVADGPPSPFWASPDQPGTDGPPSDLAPGTTKTADAGRHVDVVSGSGPESGKVDYAGLFASTAKTSGQIAEAIGKGLPAPVAKAASDAAAAKQVALQAAQASQSKTTAVTAPPKQVTGMSTGAKVGLVFGGLGVVTLVGLAATRKKRP